jgi:hypothetical protein
MPSRVLDISSGTSPSLRRSPQPRRIFALILLLTAVMRLFAGISRYFLLNLPSRTFLVLESLFYCENGRLAGLA